MCSRFLPRLYANIKCGLSQCLPYLPVPCYAVAYVLRETRLISLLLAEWIKKTQIQCVVVVSFLSFFPPHSVHASPFHVVICTNRQNQGFCSVPKPTSCGQIGERERGWGALGGQAGFRGAGVAQVGCEFWFSHLIFKVS